MLLVTGISGHTGTYFLQELINNKYEGPIRCIVRKSSNTSVIDNSGLNIEKVVGDLDDPIFINSIMIGVEMVMHIYNIHHSPLVVKVAIENKVKRAILVHTTGIYSKFKYASEDYKKVEEKISELTKDPLCPTSITILRPTMIYGDLCDRNMSKFIKMVDNLRIIPIINGGNSIIQPVNARDLGKVLFTVLMTQDHSGRKAYDISGDKPIKMIDVFNLISHELGKKRAFVSVPLNVGVLMAKVLKALSLGKIDYVERVQRMSENRSYSHDDAKRDFNYNPMSIEVGIQVEVNQYLRKIRN